MIDDQSGKMTTSSHEQSSAVVNLALPKTVAHSAEAEVGGDDDAGALAKRAQQMEQQRPADAPKGR
jgi:hypothetical protein